MPRSRYSCTPDGASTGIIGDDSIVSLCVATVGAPAAGPALTVELRLPDGATKRLTLAAGALELVPLADGAYAEATLTPAKGVDVGAGPGERLERRLRGGQVGLVFDARGRRPLEVVGDQAARWAQAMALYPA